jgi:platelet-activating factor acetylhydrolase IB subunit alpha
MKQNLKDKREAAKAHKTEQEHHTLEETKENAQTNSGQTISTASQSNNANNAALTDLSQIRDYLASGSRDKSIKIWEVKSSKCLITLIGHDNWVTDLVFHPSGKFLLSVSDDKSLRCWDLHSGRCTKKLLNIHAHFVTSVAIKQRSVITSSVDQSLKVWNCR